jgi:hypothetical protein
MALHVEAARSDWRSAFLRRTGVLAGRLFAREDNRERGEARSRTASRVAVQNELEPLQNANGASAEVSGGG